MLNYVASNIFETPAQTLVNTVNTVGVMGKGIAAEFKSRYPDMFRKYRQFCLEGSLTVGKLYLYKSPNKWILNFPTKEHWRNPSKVEFIEAGLQKFVETYAEHGIASVAFPQLGTGNGGLDWERVVRPMMDEYLQRVTIPGFVHVTRRSDAFVPEHLDAKAKRALRERRIDIGVETFLRDLSELAEVVPASDDADSEDRTGRLDRSDAERRTLLHKLSAAARTRWAPRIQVSARHYHLAVWSCDSQDIRRRSFQGERRFG